MKGGSEEMEGTRGSKEEKEGGMVQGRRGGKE